MHGMVAQPSDRLTQLRRGVAEQCVLALLRSGQRYGFDLAQQLAGHVGIVAGEGTVYPLLARLRRRGLVDTAWQESPQGPPRRYYHLTSAGRAEVDAFTFEWKSFRDAVDAILEGAT